jgi:hypothetical protein
MTLLSQLGRPQFTMNIFLHVIILFTILSALFKLVFTKLTTNVFTNVINNLMHENISKNANTMLQNSAINKVLYNLLDSKLNTYMVELTTIKNSLIVTNTYIKSVTNINKQVSGIQRVLINANLMKNPNDNSKEDSTLDKISKFNIQLINIIQRLQTIQSVLQKDPSKLELDNIIEILNQTDVFKQVSSSLNKPDQLAQTINTALFDKIMLIITFLVVFFIILVFIFSKNSDFHMSHILIETIITILFVGIIQVAFFLKIANKYSPNVASFLKTHLVGKLKEKLSKPNL